MKWGYNLKEFKARYFKILDNHKEPIAVGMEEWSILTDMRLRALGVDTEFVPIDKEEYDRISLEVIEANKKFVPKHPATEIFYRLLQDKR